MCPKIKSSYKAKPKIKQKNIKEVIKKIEKEI